MGTIPVFDVTSGLRQMRTRPLRTGLSVLGVVIGVATVVTMIALGEGARARIDTAIESLGANLLLVRPAAATREGVRLEGGSMLALTHDDARSIGNAVAASATVGSYVTAAAQIVAGNRNWRTTVAGISPGYLDVRSWSVVSGETLSRDDEENAARNVLLGATVADRLFGKADAVGRSVRVGRAPYLVRGVLAAKGRSADGRDQDDIVLMPLSTARIRVVGRNPVRPDAVDGIVIRVNDAGDIGLVTERLRAVLRARHRLAPRDADDFVVNDLTAVAETQRRVTRDFQVFVAVLAAVSLVVGGVGIMNIMLVTVAERTREIGLRMALGATNADIRAQFLVEAILITFAGAVIGILIGAAAASALSQWLGWQTELTFAAFAAAISAAMATGIGFGLYPAMRAARLEPLAALRFE